MIVALRPSHSSFHKSAAQTSVLHDTALLFNMAGLWPRLHTIKHFDRDMLRAVENEGRQWLEKFPGFHGFSSMPLDQQLDVYRILCSISTPEFINVKIDAREGV